MKKQIDKCCGNCAFFFAECTDGDGWCAKHYYSEKETRCDKDACKDFVSNEERRHYLAVLRGWKYIMKQPEQKELVKAIDFVDKYIKAFKKI